MAIEVVDWNARRKQLKMPVKALVKRSKVSRPTVFRILQGNADVVRFGSVQKVANVLGIGFGGVAVDPELLRREQAKRKAKLLRSLVQGTMALEAQGLPEDYLVQLENETIDKLLAGPGRDLWCQ
jgi:transcriptional regulator with XRE-family HTH domain